MVKIYGEESLITYEQNIPTKISEILKKLYTIEQWMDKTVPERQTIRFDLYGKVI